MPLCNTCGTPRREHSLTDMANKVKLTRESKATKKSVCVLTEQFICGKTQVSMILKHKLDYLTAFEKNADKDRKRLSVNSPLEELNLLVWERFQKARATNVPVCGPLLQEKALEFGKKLKVTDCSVRLVMGGWSASGNVMLFPSVLSVVRVSVPENICDA